MTVYGMLHYYLLLNIIASVVGTFVPLIHSLFSLKDIRAE
jgi:hypothetical protein